jgi:hypothetical protein
MCEKGVNTDQMRLMLAQVDDSLGMSQQWLEQIHHLADHADMRDSSALVAQASVMLGEARAKLEQAGDAFAGGATGDVSVERV